MQPVRHQGIVHPAKHGADVGRVFARRVEIGVVANGRRQQQLNISQRPERAFDFARERPIGHRRPDQMLH